MECLQVSDLGNFKEIQEVNKEGNFEDQLKGDSLDDSRVKLKANPKGKSKVNLQVKTQECFLEIQWANDLENV